MRMPSLLPLQLLPVNEERVAHSRARGGSLLQPPGRSGCGECTRGMFRGMCVGTLGAWLNKCLSCLIKDFNHVALKLVVFFFKIEYFADNWRNLILVREVKSSYV